MAAVVVPPLPPTLGVGTTAVRVATLETAVRNLHAPLVALAAAVNSKVGHGLRIRALETLIEGLAVLELSEDRETRRDGLDALRARPPSAP